LSLPGEPLHGVFTGNQIGQLYQNTALLPNLPLYLVNLVLISYLAIYRILAEKHYTLCATTSSIGRREEVDLPEYIG